MRISGKPNKMVDLYEFGLAWDGLHRIPNPVGPVRVRQGAPTLFPSDSIELSAFCPPIKCPGEKLCFLPVDKRCAKCGAACAWSYQAPYYETYEHEAVDAR
jgi:hypothetical protein